MIWRNLFKCKQKNNNDYILLRILGWEEFCDCSLEEPFLHAHTNKIPGYHPVIACEWCGSPAHLSYEVFGRFFASPWKKIKSYKCESCTIESYLCFNLMFKSTIKGNKTDAP
jgi:hypothetical protein